MSDVPEWPREIWMAERDEHDQGVVSAVLSEHATIPRWAGDKEREREFHRYIDADIYETADRYLRGRIAQARAEALREAADRLNLAAEQWGAQGNEPTAAAVLRVEAKAIRALIEKEHNHE